MFAYTETCLFRMQQKIHIGGNIRKWRNLKGVKQKSLAGVLRVSEASMSNIENNLTDLSLRQLEDIAQVLDIPVENLFNDPQECYAAKAKKSKAAEPGDESELMQAVIRSLEKKDQQLQSILQQVLQTMSLLATQDRSWIKPAPYAGMNSH